MGSVVIAHLIGTVSLIVLFGIVATNFTINYSFIQMEILAHNLQGISEHVSSEISDLVSLCLVSGEDQFVFKKLEIPEKVWLEAYNLSIVRSEGFLKVIAQPILRPSFYGEALLPWSTEGNIQLFNGNLTELGINDPRISISNESRVSSLREIVVWCLKNGTRTTFGLGTMEG